jgi:DNA-binding LacI/PurR family transcriptional regulator
MTVSETARPSEEVSIADVAEKAGVSVATVSRVLNGHTNVRQPTREKVLAAVAESGYRINELARNLRTAESRLLLTMVPDFGNPFYAAIVRGIDSVARQNGYFMLLCDTGADPLRERSYFDLLRGRRADGAICLDPAAVQKALAEEASALPWVACCEFDPAAGVPFVGIDNHAAAGDVVRYLIGRGHRKIALINSGHGYLYGRQRLAGYRDALHAAGIDPLPAWQIELDSLDYTAGEDAARQLAALGENRPSAVFAVSDTLAIGVINGLRGAQGAGRRGGGRLRRHRRCRAHRSAAHDRRATDAGTRRNGRALVAAAPARAEGAGRRRAAAASADPAKERVR